MPTRRRRPGMGVDVPTEMGGQGTPGKVRLLLWTLWGSALPANGKPATQSEHTRGTRILFQKRNMHSGRGCRPARRCVHPCVGPQRPAVGKAAPCPPLQRSVRSSPRAWGPGALGPSFPVCRGWTTG